ncbi:MAG: SIMPL domain-containing protein [Clostridiales bacterium]|nr:SIMPL domain-containing protein [Clostridiales bacterium]
MKRILLAVVALCAACTALAQTSEAFPSYIQVNGRAEMEVQPDEFYLAVVIDERDSKGKISVETQQREMITVLKRLGINVEQQLKVANLSSEFFKKKSSVAQAKYQLKLASAAEVARVWQALDELNISNVTIERVSHSQIDRLKQEVRMAAIRNARESAETLAGAIGQTVGKCFYIYDANSDILPRYYSNKLMTRSVATMDAMMEYELDEEESLDFKTIKLEYNVQAKFVLE